MSQLKSLVTCAGVLVPAEAWAASQAWHPSLRLSLVLLLMFAAVSYCVFLFIRFGRKAVLLTAALLLGLILTLAAAYGLGLAYLRLRPRYQVLYVQPDRNLGWIGIPHFSYPSTGEFGEFLVQVTNNSLGFRDREHAVSKPAGVVRVALLGDSLVEAIQVPMMETAAVRLEDLLNREATDTRSNLRFEVLNLGVSNYSLGQYYLVWEEHARRFRPDYVIAVVAGFQMVRTAESAPVSRILGGTSGGRLRIRPTFLVEDGGLTLHTAPDFELFSRRQRERIDREFGGSRIHRITPFDLARGSVSEIIREATGTPPAKGRSDISGKDLQMVNLLLLQKFAEEVTRSGSRLVIADLGPFYGELYDVISRDLLAFCIRSGTGYLDLSSPLLEAMEQGGDDLTWPRDGHFTSRGNEVIARAMFRYLRTGERRATPGDTPR